MKYKEYCKIVKKKINGNYLYLELLSENISKCAKPGQFVNIRINDESYDPLLRRPFSIHDIENNKLMLMVLIRGKGTKLLSKKNEGELLNVIGPLGNGFSILDLDNNKKIFFIAGGIGIAPFRFLSRLYNNSILLYGVRSKEFLAEDLKLHNNCEIHIITEDGSYGNKGNIIDLMKLFNFENSIVYICGPNKMLIAIKKYFEDIELKNQEIYVSLENYMGCGFGICKGCSVEYKDGKYKLSCIDGPVFKLNEINL